MFLHASGRPMAVQEVDLTLADQIVHAVRYLQKGDRAHDIHRVMAQAVRRMDSTGAAAHEYYCDACAGQGKRTLSWRRLRI